jgi:replicative DNA helicase
MSDYFNNDAEVAVLSIIVKTPSSFFNLTDLKSFMFSSEVNKCLFTSISELIITGVLPDFNLLINYLRSSTKLNQCGGEQYLSYLNTQDYKQEYLKDFESFVVNSFKARTLISLSTQIPEIIKGQNDIDGAISFIRDSVDSLSDLEGGGKTVTIKYATKEAWDDLLIRVNSDSKIKVTTGFKHLDAVTYGYESGDLWIIAGRPGHGKSAFMINSAINTAETGIPVLLFSKEMHRKSLINRIMAIKTGIPIYNIALGILTQKQVELIGEKIKEIKDLPIFIDTNFTGNLGYVYTTIRRYNKIHGVKVNHIDYVQLLVERSSEATHELGRVSRELKLLAEDIEVCNVIYSQLNREVEKRNDKRPMLSDLRQSGNLEEDADVVMFLYRDEIYNRETKYLGKQENIVSKQRNGPVGVVISNFDKETNRIYEG